MLAAGRRLRVVSGDSATAGPFTFSKCRILHTKRDPADGGGHFFIFLDDYDVSHALGLREYFPEIRRNRGFSLSVLDGYDNYASLGLYFGFRAALFER